MKALATALLALALLPAAAAAKSGVMMQSTPDGLRAGDAWLARFEVMRNDAAVDPRGGKSPYVRITNRASGSSRNFEARRGHDGFWTAQVVFPAAGEWTYSVEGFGGFTRHQFFEPAQIAARPERRDPPVVTAASGGGSFPYGWASAGAALALVAGGLLVRRLRA